MRLLEARTEEDYNAVLKVAKCGSGEVEDICLRAPDVINHMLQMLRFRHFHGFAFKPDVFIKMQKGAWLVSGGC